MNRSHTSHPGVTANEPGGRFELRFPSLFDTGRALCFPCNESGDVALDDMGERMRNNYFLARTLVGRDWGCPKVYAPSGD
jgi:hypothetical protein